MSRPRVSAEKLEAAVLRAIREAGLEDEGIAKAMVRNTLRTRERHDRETDAKFGKTLDVGREAVRKVSALKAAGWSDDPTLRPLLVSGELTISKAYAALKGDRRAGLFVKVPPELKERASRAAFEGGITLAELVTQALGNYLTQISGEAEE